MTIEVGRQAIDWLAVGQTVGSVGAVFAAIWAVWQTQRQTRLAAKAETVRTVELVCSVGYLMSDLVSNAFNGLKAGSPFDRSNFTLILGLFDAFPFDKYPSGEMALRLANIHRLCVAFEEAYFETVAAMDVSSWISATSGKPSPAMENPAVTYERTEIISAEYDSLVRAGQAILDSLPGRRVVIPVGITIN